MLILEIEEAFRIEEALKMYKYNNNSMQNRIGTYIRNII